MKMAMKIAALFIFVVGAASPAWAQFNSWGTGMWGANQACNQPYRVAAGSSSELDGVREAQNEISKAERELRKKKTELKKMERDLERARSDIENSVASEFSDFVFEHIENGRSCGAYDGAQGDVGACGENEPGCVAHEAGVPVRAYSQAEWSRACASSYSGVVNNQYVCSLQRSRNSDGRGATVSDCQKALGIYTKGYKKKMTTEREIERLERMIENWKDDIQTAKEDYIDSLRDRQSNTEGGICFDCIMGSGAVQAERQTDWANVLANGLVGGLAMYMGYQTNKMVSQNNAALGWPSQPYPAWGYGLPFIQNAIYGAMGGGIGQGGFGCAGGMNGGGYGMGPGGMMGNPWGGGMYQPGMGPWGMNGPFGGMGMPYPGAYGMPAMGMPMSNGMMMGGGMPGMGMMGGMGMPGMGMAGMGMPGMGMMGGMGMPGMGMAGMGMPGMGMMGGMGMPGMGMMAGMGMPGMGMMGGMGMPGMGMAGMGMPGMGMGGYDMSAQMQMQQQMMQMQMQQYQAAMQQQMQAQQSYMQRQQIVSGLQQEMYQLMNRIQQVQMGGIGYGGVGGGIGVGGTIGIGGAIGTGGGYLGNTPYYPPTTTPTPVQGTIGR